MDIIIVDMGILTLSKFKQIPFFGVMCVTGWKAQRKNKQPLTNMNPCQNLK
jgi:hypothetical protein